MQKNTETTEKDVIIEGMRFTPEMLKDVIVDKEKLLKESYSAIRGSKTTDNRDKSKVQKALSILSQIVGLGFLALLFFLVDPPILKAAFGIAFVLISARRIYNLIKQEEYQRFSIKVSKEDLLKYGGYAILIGLGVLAVYFLIVIISEYIIWVLLIVVFIAWLKGK